MKLKFFKYEGAGNDFIMIDNRNQGFAPTQPLINKLCNRHFGIGADGLILLENDDNTSFFMRYFNADGIEGTMCGNGGRCIAFFAYLLKISDKIAVFNAADGKHEAEICSVSGNVATVKLKMKNVLKPETIFGFRSIDTGSPHLIIPSDDLENLDVFSLGSDFRNDKRFSDNGINVNFLRFKNGKAEMRTYERGVENETLACGTGAVAAAVAILSEYPNTPMPVSISALGGVLKVHLKKENGLFTNIWLEGPATFVFEGIIEL